MPAIHRRTFIAQLGGRGAALALTGAACVSSRRAAAELPIYIGTYTRGGSRGIYRVRMDSATGRIAVDGAVAEVENPSFLALNPARTHVYSVSEVGEFEGTAGGGVAAYAIEAGGGLRELNRQPTHGGAPCHLRVDESGQHLLVANYTGGNATLLPIEQDGSLRSASQVVQHEGSGPDRQRQEAPHAHFVALDASNRFAFVVDLGIDRIVGYRFDPVAGRLVTVANAGVAARPGAGPRHLDFHPDGRRAYIINELDSTLTSVSYDPATGSMESLGTVSTLPPDYSGDSSCAHVQVAPSGRFVYGSNRGHDSIAVFEIGEGGAARLVQHQSTLGRTPRNFAIDPSGRYLVAANQDTDTLVTFVIDPSSGLLSPVGEPVEVPVPVCVLFA